MNRRTRRLAETRIERHAEIENYVGIALTKTQRDKLQQLVDLAPTKTEEEVVSFALEIGVDRLLDAEDDDVPVDGGGNNEAPTAQEEVALLARAFQVRETLKTPSSVTVYLETMDRYAIDRLRNATGMKLDDVIKLIVAKGIAQLMNDHGIEKGKPRTIEV